MKFMKRSSEYLAKHESLIHCFKGMKSLWPMVSHIISHALEYLATAGSRLCSARSSKRVDSMFGSVTHSRVAKS